MHPWTHLAALLLLLAALITMAAPLAPARGETLSVVGFNVESGGADPQVVDDVIAAAEGVDVWGFSEVDDDGWAQLFEAAAEDGEGANFERILGSTGDRDRLLIVYDADRLTLLETFELSEINVGGHVRAPLVARFRIGTADAQGPEFLFMVNHLYRSRAERRHQQAQLLNAWARNQTVPVIAVGDYNFDWSVIGGDGDHDAGYDQMTADGVFRWVRPTQLIRTQCSEHDSVLDFVFVAGPAQAWQGTSEILETQPSYCPDSAATSDHRPLLATFETGGTSLRVQLLERLSAVESEIQALRTAIEAIEE